MTEWTRPSTVPFPTIWATFEGRKEINGFKRKYWIQDITDEYKDQVVKYMVENFTAEEPLCKYSNERDQPGLLDIFGMVCEKQLKDNLGLVCLTNDENGKPTIAAMNCTTLSKIDDEDNYKGIQSRILDITNYIKAEADTFRKLNLTKYLYAIGLYVLTNYRGEGLGLELLKARKPLCKACGLSASVTIFTSAVSQKLAERAGFKDLYRNDYEELAKMNPRFSFPGIEKHTKTIRVMYIIYD